MLESRKSIDQNILFRIGTLLRISRQGLDELMLPYDLSRYEWLIIAVIKYSTGEVTQKMIKEYTGIDDSYLTKVLDKLEKREIITKSISTKNRRFRVVNINRKSGQMVNDIFDIIAKLNQETLSALSPEEQVQLFEYLERLSVKAKEIA